MSCLGPGCSQVRVGRMVREEGISEKLGAQKNDMVLNGLNLGF